MAKKSQSARRRTSAIEEFLQFVEAHSEQSLGQSDADRLFDLDFAAGAECKKRGISVPNSDSKRHTTYMKLTYGEESIYAHPGMLASDGPGNDAAYTPLIVDPEEDWLNWLRAVVRQLPKSKAVRAISRRATIATKIELLKREMKEHLISARDFAHSTKDESGTPELLPRPLKKDLAKRLGMKPYDVTRCLQDDDAAELKLYWETAADLDGVMNFSAL